MINLTKCGYCCDLCKAYLPNILKNDQRKELSHCGECSNYPCDKFNQRKGLSAKEVKKILGSDYDDSQYNEYLLAYDNKTRIDEYKRNSID